MAQEIISYLDWMDRTRNIRTQGRPEIWQMDGYRREWNRYMDEWVDDNADRR